MSDLMLYKGYMGRVEFDAEQNVLFGRVLGLRDVITFQGDSVSEIRKAFEDSVDDYLEFCAERGVPPEESKSGKFNLRLDPETHRCVALAAEIRNVSMNEWIVQHVRKDAEQEVRDYLKG